MGRRSAERRDVDRHENLMRGSFLVVDLRGVPNEIAGLLPLRFTLLEKVTDRRLAPTQELDENPQGNLNPDKVDLVEVPHRWPEPRRLQR